MEERPGKVPLLTTPFRNKEDLTIRPAVTIVFIYTILLWCQYLYFCTSKASKAMAAAASPPHARISDAAKPREFGRVQCPDPNITRNWDSQFLPARKTPRRRVAGKLCTLITCISPDTSAYVNIRHHTSSYVSIRKHT